MDDRIKLHVKPGEVCSWEQFRASYPSHSIALDGFVQAPPEFDQRGPYANFDHHAGVSRLATRSTSMQVLVAICMGLFDTFRVEGAPFANVYVNDCDQDVCLSYFLLLNADKVDQIRVEDRIGKLILFEDFMDSTAGALPLDLDGPMIREQAWVFELYDRARVEGRLPSMSSAEMRDLILETSFRIREFAYGRGGQRKLDTRFEELGGGPNWKLIYEYGLYARTRLFAEGTRAFVAVRPLTEGRFAYTIGRMSPFVPFPMREIFQKLNDLEQRGDSMDCWGGSDIIGGSPRKTGSMIPPREVEQVINQLLSQA